MGTDLQQLGEERPTRRGAATMETDLPWNVAFVAGLHILWGIVVLLLLLIGVVMWASSGPGAFDQGMREKGLSEGHADLLFFLWIAFGAANVAAGLWLRRCQRRGLWLAALCSTSMLAAGLVDTARAEVDVLTILVSYAFPLLSLYVVARHRHIFTASGGA